MFRKIGGLTVPYIVDGTISEANTALFWPAKAGGGPGCELAIQLGAARTIHSVFTTQSPSTRQLSPGELFSQPRFTTPPLKFCQTVALVTVTPDPQIIRESSPLRINTLDAMVESLSLRAAFSLFQPRVFTLFTVLIWKASFAAWF